MLESTLLFIPFGKELLLVVLSANQPSWFFYYAAVATGASLLGSLLVDGISRKTRGVIDRRVPPQRFQFAEARVRQHGGWALSAAALMPPPFPFSAFLAAAAGLGYPRKRLFALVGAARLLRFTVVAGLAARYGENLLALGQSASFRYSLLVLIILALGAAGVALYRWSRREVTPETPL